MSAYSHSMLDLAVRHPLDPATTEQLRLSRVAAHRFSVTQAIADQRSSSKKARRPGRPSVWARARRVLARPRPA